jgi:hypothetical protein
MSAAETCRDGDCWPDTCPVCQWLDDCEPDPDEPEEES